MQKLRNKLIALAAVGILAAVGTLMNSPQSTVQGAGGPTVTIDQAQLPLPVQGSLGVSGTVAATQSGSWNVGISGTPNVNVSNPATAPVLALNVDDPGRIPYQSDTSILGSQCGTSGFPLCTVGFGSVPSGRRLVIQHVSVLVELSANVPATVELFGFSISGGINFLTNSVSSINGVSVEAADQTVLAYFDPGTSPEVGVSPGSANPQILLVGANLSGYMLDCTIAHCAAIAH